VAIGVMEEKHNNYQHKLPNKLANSPNQWADKLSLFPINIILMFPFS
jgi:hypothetical protein